MRARRGPYTVTASVACVVLLSRSACANVSRGLQQAEGSGTLCSWYEPGACDVNGQLLYDFGALGSDLENSEQEFWNCFNVRKPYQSCEQALNPGLEVTPPVAALVEPETVTATAAPAPVVLPPPIVEAPPSGDELNMVAFPFTVVPEAAELELSPSLLAPLPPGVPDYSTPAKCPGPTGRTNPLTSGDLPEVFEYPSEVPPEGYTPFAPDDTLIENQSICVKDTPATLHAHGQVLMKDPETGLCQSCPEAKCTIWVPDYQGNYQPHCTGVTPLDANGEFDLYFPTPGNEYLAGWGPDGNPHVHFRCDGCGGFIYNKWMPDPTDQYCATSTVYNMLMSAPDASNQMQSVPIGGSPGTFHIIMMEDWEMRLVRDDKDSCWTKMWGKPCPEYFALKNAGKDCSYMVGPNPEPPGDPVGTAPAAALPIEATPVAEPVAYEGCAIEGYDYFGTDHDIPGVLAAQTETAEECVALCTNTLDCEAVTFIMAEVSHSCYLKGGLDLTGPAGVEVPGPQDLKDFARVLIYVIPCEDLVWAEVAAGPAAAVAGAAATAAARRRLSQAAEDGCVTHVLSETKSMCGPKAAFTAATTSGEAPDKETTFEAALPVLSDVRSFKLLCPHTDLLAGTSSTACDDMWRDYLQTLGCATCFSDLAVATTSSTLCANGKVESTCTSAVSTSALDGVNVTQAARSTNIDIVGMAESQADAIAIAEELRAPPAVATPTVTNSSGNTQGAATAQQPVATGTETETGGLQTWHYGALGAAALALIVVVLCIVGCVCKRGRRGKANAGNSGPYVSQPLDGAYHGH